MLTLNSTELCSEIVNNANDVLITNLVKDFEKSMKRFVREVDIMGLTKISTSEKKNLHIV